VVRCIRERGAALDCRSVGEAMVVVRMGYDVIVVALRCEIESRNGKGCTVCIAGGGAVKLVLRIGVKSRLGLRGRLSSSGLRDLCFKVAGAFRLAVVFCLRQGRVCVERDRQDFNACLLRCGRGDASVGGAGVREILVVTPAGARERAAWGVWCPHVGIEASAEGGGCKDAVAAAGVFALALCRVGRSGGHG